MKVIVGLGNPGAQYANTPHSIGFEVVDAVAASMGVTWKDSSSFKGAMAKGMFGGEAVILLKPMTFMNLSGESVAPVVKYHNAQADRDLVVISDDIDLPAGKLRIRKGGGAGGHNGLRSVIACTGTPDFVRVRVGVGRDAQDGKDVIGHVLGKFSPEARAAVNETLPSVVQALETIVKDGVEAAMNRYNGAAQAAKPVTKE